MSTEVYAFQSRKKNIKNRETENKSGSLFGRKKNKFPFHQHPWNIGSFDLPLKTVATLATNRGS